MKLIVDAGDVTCFYNFFSCQQKLDQAIKYGEVQVSSGEYRVENLVDSDCYGAAMLLAQELFIKGYYPINGIIELGKVKSLDGFYKFISITENKQSVKCELTEELVQVQKHYSAYGYKSKAPTRLFT